MKIISWNINGLRSIIKKSYLFDLINIEEPDIICLNEIKMSESCTEIEEIINENIKIKYYYYWHIGQKKGYSGTCVFTKKKPINIIYGLNINNIEYDFEGRVILCDYKKFYLINIYTPNSGEMLVRLDYRINEWDVKFREYIFKLQKTKPVIICGDLNVAHNEIDLKNPKKNLKNAGFTIEERTSFNLLLDENNLIDSFRILNPDEIKYSYWSYRYKSRVKNNGWRIDYFLVSSKLKNKILTSDILTDIMGSDHCPIILNLIQTK